MSRSRKTWKFSQCFGDDGQVGEVSEADVLSAVEFDHTGEFLATGDKGGCMCIFRRESSADEYLAEEEEKKGDGEEKPKGGSPFWKSGKKGSSSGSKEDASKRKTSLQYNFYAEFQSHEPEFDYLKSLEIEEKINKIKFCRHSNNSLLLLSTNDKTIKLWKIYEKKIKQISAMNVPGGRKGGVAGAGANRWVNGGGRGGGGMLTRAGLRVPKLTDGESVVAAYNRRKFSNAHAYHINSVSLCSDGETFISADDLRINLWNLNLAEQSFNIVDIKPDNMEMLTEVITAAEFHPRDCHTFMYSSSCGKINVGDLRQRAICGSGRMKCLMEPEDPASKSFFSEIIASISHVCFSPCGKYAISRDYLKLKVWDLAMERRPVRSVNINEHLRPKLCDLYENDCIFDKFEFSVGRDNGILTGTYDNNINVYDFSGKEQARIRIGGGNIGRKTSKMGFGKFGKRKADGEFPMPNVDTIDFSRKILHVAWNPRRDVVAIAAKSQLFMYGVF